jgi:di/tricarboxylate transporter
MDFGLLATTTIDLHGWIAVATLVAAAVLFYARWVPIGVTALAIPVVLAATGVLHDPKDALSGFGNPAVIAIGAFFVLGSALQETGVATLVARGLQRVAGRSEIVLVTVVMLATAALSLFLNNAAVVGLLLPATVTLSRRALVPSSRVLMPVAFAAVLGGVGTSIGTAPNLLIAENHGLHLFDFALVGLPVILTGTLFTVLVARPLLPRRGDEDRLREAKLPEAVAASYGVPEHLHLMRVVPGSHLCGRTMAEAGIRARYGINVVLVVRPGKIGAHHLTPAPDLVLEAEDRLYVEGEPTAVWRLSDEELLQMGLPGPQALEGLLGRGVTLAEVAVPPRSMAVGQTFRDLDFSRRFGLQVLSLWRRGAPVREGIADFGLEVGDAFLVSGPVEQVRRFSAQRDYIVLTDNSGAEDVRRAPLSIAILLLALVPAVMTWLPLYVSALGGALLMVATHCVSAGALRRAVDWQVLALIAGTIPLGQALLQHHVADAAARAILAATSEYGEAAVLGALFAVTAAVAMASTHAAAAVILAPVAVQAATAGGADLRSALLAVAYGCSCTYMQPFSPCNLLVIGPGAYRSRDYLLPGLGVSVVMGATVVAGLVWLR